MIPAVMGLDEVIVPAIFVHLGGIGSLGRTHTSSMRALHGYVIFSGGTIL